MDIMKHCLLTLGLLFSTNLFSAATSPVNHEQPRLFVLTDIENEPDDAESLVRLLVHSNHYQIEGLVAATSIWLPDRTAPERIEQIVDTYGKVRDNLLLHESGFPPTESLKKLISSGPSAWGMEGVGEDWDSSGSKALIKAVDADSRPLWVTAWGGTNVLAQALWKVQQTRSSEELAQFVSKIRTYAISDQDNSGPWIRKTFPDLFYIVSPGYQENGGNGYQHAAWVGISGDNFHGNFTGADSSLVSNEWLSENISENHGPLGKAYPKWEYLMEGDTPAFLYLFPNGLSSPENPNFGSWGGRYESYTPENQSWFHEPETRPIWSNAVDTIIGTDGKSHTDIYATIHRWREAYQNEFAARMDWCVKSYEQANHPPIIELTHPETITLQGGDTVSLDASPSSDPDNDVLEFEWFQYKEADNFTGQIEFSEKDKASTTLQIPQVTTPQTAHIIISVNDNGSPSLFRYKRVILNILPKS